MVTALLRVRNISRNGQVVPWPPFLTAMQTPSEIVPMLKEIALYGTTMAVVYIHRRMVWDDSDCLQNALQGSWTRKNVQSRRYRECALNLISCSSYCGDSRMVCEAAGPPVSPGIFKSDVLGSNTDVDSGSCDRLSAGRRPGFSIHLQEHFFWGSS